MVRKRDRVIATLVVWIAVFISMAVILGRLTGPGVDLQNFWYYSGNVVTGGSSEEAIAALDNLNKITAELQFQTQQYAQTAVFAYLPYIILLTIIFLGGGMLSTFFIWRSVAVPGELVERVKEYREGVPQPRAVHLDDDGELLHTAPESQPNQNDRERVR